MGVSSARLSGHCAMWFTQGKKTKIIFMQYSYWFLKWEIGGSGTEINGVEVTTSNWDVRLRLRDRHLVLSCWPNELSSFFGEFWWKLFLAQNVSIWVRRTLIYLTAVRYIFSVLFVCFFYPNARSVNSKTFSKNSTSTQLNFHQRNCQGWVWW